MTNDDLVIDGRFSFPWEDPNEEKERWLNVYGDRWSDNWDTLSQQEKDEEGYLRQIYQGELSTEGLQELYDSIDWTKLPLNSTFLQNAFILHPKATSELIQAILDSLEGRTGYLYVIKPIISARATSTALLEHLIDTLGTFIDHKIAIVDHPNSNFEIWAKVWRSGILTVEAQRELARRPAFQEGLRASFTDFGGEDLSSLPFEWLLGLWKMTHVEKVSVV